MSAGGYESWFVSARGPASPRALWIRHTRLRPGALALDRGGPLSLGGELVPLGGLGRRPAVSADPGRLTASIPAPGSRPDLTVSTADDHAAAVAYADPRGGTRLVRRAALAGVELQVRRRGHGGLTMSGTCGACEYGTSQHLPAITPQPLPGG